MRYGEEDIVYKPSGVHQKVKYVPSGVYERQFPKFQIGHTQQLDATVPIPKNAPIAGGTLVDQGPLRSARTVEQYLGDYQGVQSRFGLDTVVEQYSTPNGTLMAILLTIPQGFVWKLRSMSYGLTTSTATNSRYIKLGFVPPQTPLTLQPSFVWSTPFIGPFGASGTPTVYQFQGYPGYPVNMEVTSANPNENFYHFWMPYDWYLEEYWMIWVQVNGFDHTTGIDIVSSLSHLPFLVYDSWSTIPERYVTSK